jgi:uncharacterized membrane protein YgaE (UPF0421/DUF939 family)
MGDFKLFQREPTLWIAVLNAVVILGGTFGLHLLSGQQASLIVVAINAVFLAINAWAVRPISPVAFTYALGAILAVVSAYGLNVSTETMAALNALVIPVLALLSRGQVSPQETVVTKS